MLNVKLKYLRTIIEEISRLEKLTDQMSRVRNQSKKQDYYEDLKWCREEKRKLIKEELLEKIPLSKEEMQMAKNYYYKGMTWNDAFEVSELYSNLKNPTDSEVDKAVRRYKKYIERMTQKFY